MLANCLEHRTLSMVLPVLGCNSPWFKQASYTFLQPYSPLIGIRHVQSCDVPGGEFELYDQSHRKGLESSLLNHVLLLETPIS